MARKRKRKIKRTKLREEREERYENTCVVLVSENECMNEDLGS